MSNPQGYGGEQKGSVALLFGASCPLRLGDYLVGLQGSGGFLTEGKGRVGESLVGRG